MKNIHKFIFLLVLLDSSLGIVPIWKIAPASINLLSSSNPYEYLVVDRELYEMKVKLKKVITKSGTEITHSNYLKIGDGGTFNQVNFENIESFYKINNVNLICPKGKSHLYNADTNQNITFSWFQEKENWDFKCYKHYTN